VIRSPQSVVRSPNGWSKQRVGRQRASCRLIWRRARALCWRSPPAPWGPSCFWGWRRRSYC